MKKVLILEDEVSIRSFVVINLQRAGYDVIEAGTGEDALDQLRKNPDTGVAIFDINLPGMDGFEVCRTVRATNKSIGIIMLTARTQEMDKVTGLMTGADDYVTKPFSPAELTARVDALYRRIGGEAGASTEEIRQGPFVLNTRNRTLEKGGEKIRLTQVEYSIVKLFMQNPGRALSREDILAAVWGRDYDGELKIVDVNIRRLRIKIEDDWYAEWYRDINENEDDYDGKTFILKGRVALSEELPEGQFAFGRHVMTCCEADIQFAGLLSYYSGHEKLNVGDWIEITAKVRVEYAEAYQEKGPVLYIRKLAKCEPCSPEVATF